LHTFCSRLAMAGAWTMAIKELAGHQQTSTTQRYMRVSPAAKSAAIRLLDCGADRIAEDLKDTENSWRHRRDGRVPTFRAIPRS
jgi:hypothetical protein